MDHYSRTIIGFATFKKQPSSDEVIAFMAKAVRAVGMAPRHLISDQGTQFTSEALRTWCSEAPRAIRQRFGTVGEYGSIAIVERPIRFVKEECTRRILVPLRGEAMRTEMTLYIDWYNKHRSHQALGGRVPMSVYSGGEDETLCFETRGKDGAIILLVVYGLNDRKHLPVVELERAA